MKNKFLKVTENFQNTSAADPQSLTLRFSVKRYIYSTKDHFLGISQKFPVHFYFFYRVFFSISYLYFVRSVGVTKVNFNYSKLTPQTWEIESDLKSLNKLCTVMLFFPCIWFFFAQFLYILITYKSVTGKLRKSNQYFC